MVAWQRLRFRLAGRRRQDAECLSRSWLLDPPGGYWLSGSEPRSPDGSIPRPGHVVGETERWFGIASHVVEEQVAPAALRASTRSCSTARWCPERFQRTRRTSRGPMWLSSRPIVTQRPSPCPGNRGGDPPVVANTRRASRVGAVRVTITSWPTTYRSWSFGISITHSYPSGYKSRHLCPCVRAGHRPSHGTSSRHDRAKRAGHHHGDVGTQRR